jgi:cytochrome P450
MGTTKASVNPDSSTTELAALPIETAEFWADAPWEGLSRLRKEAPVVRYDHLNAWVVSRHADVKAMFRESGHAVTSRRGVMLNDAIHGFMMGKFFTEGSEPLPLTDGDRHAFLMKAVRGAFTPKRMELLAEPLREYAREQIAALEFDTPTDALELANGLPIQAIVRLLGVSQQDAPRLRQWADELMILGAAATLEELLAAAPRMEPFIEFAAAELEAHRVEPREDLLTTLAEAVDRNDGLTAENAISLAQLVLAAGHDTTAGMLGSVQWYLAQNQGVLPQVRANPDLAGRVFEEVLRLAPVRQGNVRSAAKDFELGGHLIREGDYLWLSIMSANRDEAVFDDPDTFRLDRPNPTDHLTFGFGAHHCIGGPLARLEGRIFIEELAKHVSSIELAGQPRLVPANQVYEFEELTLTYRR